MAQTVYTPVLVSANIDPGLIQTATVNLSSANILAMNGAPVTILPSPGTGKALIIHGIMFEMTTTATVYANGGVVTFQYNGGSVASHAGSVPAATVNAVAGTTNTYLGPPVAANGTIVPANKAIEITNATAAFITGTGTAKIQLWYSLVTL